jgi:hypothetical protein
VRCRNGVEIYQAVGNLLEIDPEFAWIVLADVRGRWQVFGPTNVGIGLKSLTVSSFCFLLLVK